MRSAIPDYDATRPLPLPDCSILVGGVDVKHSRVQEWVSDSEGRIYPKHPRPEACWFELGGEVQLLDPDGDDVTHEYAQGMITATWEAE